MKELAARLVAVLPFPASDFRADFQTEDSCADFSSLLENASAVFEVPVPEHDNWKQGGAARDIQYARVGALIAEQSQILLAVWDGRPARGLGGTADVIDWFERGYAPEDYSICKGDLSLFDPPQPGLCIHIDPITANRRYRNAPPTRRSFGLSDRLSICDILRRTDTYNRDVDRQAAYRFKSTPLVPAETLMRVPVHEAFAAFREADALAVFYARRVHLADWVLYALALTAVFAFSSIDDKPIASWSFLGVMALIAIVASYVWGQSLDTKFLEYRSLAEAMRILFFWRMLGLKRQVWLSYLSKHGTVVRWLRHAVRAVEFAQDNHPALARSQPPVETRINIAIKHWVGPQIAYFKRSALWHAGNYRRGQWVTRVAIASTFATSILLAAMTLSYGDGWYAWHADAVVPLPFGSVPIGTFIKQLQLAVSFMAALGIAARGFLLRTADLDLSKQYGATREKFDRAEAALSKVPTGDPDQECPAIFERLGREALLEQAEWLWVRHSRPFEPPN